jgi:hypothetical protein
LNELRRRDKNDFIMLPLSPVPLLTYLVIAVIYDHNFFTTLGSEIFNFNTVNVVWKDLLSEVFNKRHLGRRSLINLFNGYEQDETIDQNFYRHLAFCLQLEI